MHINTVKVREFYISYDIEDVNGKIQIVAQFTKNGETVHKIYNICSVTISGAKMVAKLLDDDFAKEEAEQMIAEANKSKHSPLA